MYTLRKVFFDGVEANIVLGDSYLVVKKDVSSKAFDKTYLDCFHKGEAIYSTPEDITGDLEVDKWKFWHGVSGALNSGAHYIEAEGNYYYIENYDRVKPIYGRPEVEIHHEVYAFVISDGGKEIYPLYKNQKNFIMTETGKTFNNLTFK